MTQFFARLFLATLVLLGVTAGVTWLRTKPRRPRPVFADYELPTPPVSGWAAARSLAEVEGVWEDVCNDTFEEGCGARVVMQRREAQVGQRYPWEMQVLAANGGLITLCHVAVELRQGARLGECFWDGTDLLSVREVVVLDFYANDHSQLRVRLGNLNLLVTRLR